MRIIFKIYKSFFILILVLIVLYENILSLDIKAELEKLYSVENNFIIKKHIKLAQQYFEKNYHKSFLEEIRVIIQLKKENTEILNQIIAEVKGEQITNNSVENSETNLIMNRFEKANKYYKESKLLNALAELQDILKLDKENKTASQMIKEISNEEFLFDDTKPFQSLVKELYEKGMAFYRKGLYKEAIEKFEKAKDLDAANNQVKKFLNLSQEKLLSIKDKEDEDRLIEQADKARTDGEIKKARSLYEKVYINNKNNKHAEFYVNEFNRISNELFEKAKALKEENKMRESYEKIKEALEFNEKNISAKDMEKELKIKLAIFNEKEKTQKKVNQLYNKGVACFEKGDYESACKYWDEVLKINPDDEQAKKNIEIAKAKLEEAKIHKQEKIKKLIADAETLINQGLLEKAKSKYEYILRLDAENTEAKTGIKKIEELNTIKVGEKIDKR